MSNGNGQPEGGVALLVDFENLAMGAGRGAVGEVDCAALLALAARYGPVYGANLYADWSQKTMRPYVERYYGLGLEFVQVLGRYRKGVLRNAVDLRMAFDAADLMHTMPCIDVYVLGTGDGDFVQVVQGLQRHGRRVVGVAPQDCASVALVGVCDRFVYHESIAWRTGPGPWATAPGRDPARALVRSGRVAGRAVRRVLGFRGWTPDWGRRPAGEDLPRAHLPGGGTGARIRPATVDGRSRAVGWGWFEWAREQVESGAVAVNADGGWLHRVGDAALVVEPDCFEAWAAREGVAAKTAKNRVRRLQRHRVRRRKGRVGDRFHAVLGDGRRVHGMLVPGELLWGDDDPEDGTATLVG